MDYKGEFVRGISGRPARRRKVEIVGTRTTPCSVCHKVLRKCDINEQGVCQWCAWPGEAQAKEVK